MNEFRRKTCLVWDHGLFVEIAARLSRDFGRVLYFSPWVTGFPKSNALMIGEGIPGVERVKDPWAHYDDVDLWVFTDTGEPDTQEFLIKQGKRVWGCAGSAWLESDRVRSKKACAKAGIQIGPYEVITGLDALREHLQENDDRYVKISETRGDFETFHAETYEQIEPRLDELEHTLGAKKTVAEFIVEEPINDAVEVGYDGYSIDGVFPKGALVGVESKDRGYVGKTMRYAALPEAVREVNEKLSPILKRERHRGFMSTEIRINKEGNFLIDPCQRCGSPPSEVYQELIYNLAEIIWYGAEGIVVEPEYSGKWAAQIVLLSDWADKNWQQVRFPSELRDHVKLKNFTVIDGNYYVIPQWSNMPELGAVVATGNTAKEAMEACEAIAKEVDGYSVEKPVGALQDAHKNLLASLKDAGQDKPASKEQTAAEGAMKEGKISQRAYDKLAAQHGWV